LFGNAIQKKNLCIILLLFESKKDKKKEKLNSKKKMSKTSESCIKILNSKSFFLGSIKLFLDLNKERQDSIMEVENITIKHNMEKIVNGGKGKMIFEFIQFNKPNENLSTKYLVIMIDPEYSQPLISNVFTLPLKNQNTKQTKCSASLPWNPFFSYVKPHDVYDMDTLSAMCRSFYDSLLIGKHSEVLSINQNYIVESSKSNRHNHLKDPLSNFINLNNLINSDIFVNYKDVNVQEALEIISKKTVFPIASCYSPMIAIFKY